MHREDYLTPKAEYYKITCVWKEPSIKNVRETPFTNTSYVMRNSLKGYIQHIESIFWIDTYTIEPSTIEEYHKFLGYEECQSSSVADTNSKTKKKGGRSQQKSTQKTGREQSVTEPSVKRATNGTKKKTLSSTRSKKNSTGLEAKTKTKGESDERSKKQRPSRKENSTEGSLHKETSKNSKVSRSTSGKSPRVRKA